MGGSFAWELPTQTLKTGFYRLLNATDLFPFKVLFTFIFRMAWSFGVLKIQHREIETFYPR